MRRLLLLAPFILTACEPTFYWHQKRLHPDTVPDIVNAQNILEHDLAACHVETESLNQLAEQNDPVSVPGHHVVDRDGRKRSTTSLPTVYELDECMDRKGWVKVEHYYTIPY